ncbi:MAG TPA: lipid-A-disaccharide synthase [Stellaceae bacterium]|nr:lipid-A-disaccharide synthase [Stellaceae bacterium]
MSDAPLIYMIAGEPSGDLLGGRIMAALKEETQGRVRFAGIGGPRMAEQGLTSLVPISELAVMGLAEVLPHARRILRRIRETVADIAAKRPDIVVTIDSSGFNWRVARRLRAAGHKVRLVHVVAPMVWAWRAHRAAEIARWYDRLLVLLPFEPPYFQKHGLATTFVGHPVIESGADKGDGAGFRARHNIAPDAKLLIVLPGSRRGEVSRLLPPFVAAVGLLARRYPDFRIAVPTLDHVAAPVRAAAWPIAPVVVVGESEKHAAFAAGDVALAASGTVALELALAHLPSVIAYRINYLTHAIARRMVKVKFANLVNLLLDRAAIPELIQADCTPARLADAVSHLLDDADARARQIAAYDAALDMLGRGGDPPGRRAARQILAMLSS